MYLDRVKQKLEQANFVRPDQLKPASPEQIETLEQPLPGAYKEFLLWMGSGAGPFLRGEDCFFPLLPHLQEDAALLLAEEEFPQSLPDDAFVFLMHQGYQFAFFRLTEGEDPPVYHYREGMEEETFPRVADSFSQYLASIIDDYLRLYADFPELREWE